jgi:hypothetical protein
MGESEVSRTLTNIRDRIVSIDTSISNLLKERQNLMMFLKQPVQNIFDGTEAQDTSTIVDIMEQIGIHTVEDLLRCEKKTLLGMFSREAKDKILAINDALERHSLSIL